MSYLSTLLFQLFSLHLVRADGGTCQAENHPIYVKYFYSTISSENVVQEVPSLFCNGSGVSPGNEEVAMDAGPDTCCPCGKGILLCESLDDAFSSLANEITSQGGLYASIAMNGTEDSSAYILLHPHTLNGNWGEIAIHGLGDVSIECEPGAGLVISMFSTVIIEGTSWKECGLVKKQGSIKFHGALVIFDSYNVSLCDVAFEGSRGSSVLIKSTLESGSGYWIFQRCYFGANRESPTAVLGGGSVYYYLEGKATGSLAFIDSQFVSNVASNGGAVYIISYLCTNLTFSDCNFTNNTAVQGNGGAVFVKMDDLSSTLACENSIFNKNRAANKGGAVYITQGGEYLWKWSLFLDNTAEKGGAIYYIPEHTYLGANHDFLDCSWRNNSARNSGGAVSFMSSTSLSFNYCIWSSNNADTSAAIFALNIAKVTVINSVLVRNYVRSILYNQDGTNCIVNVNTSKTLLTNVRVQESTGSGLCSYHSDIQLSGINNFTKNLGYKGGGINLVSTSLLYFLHSESKLIFNANNATYGGGVYQKNFGTTACLFQYPKKPTSIEVIFENNYGYITGNSIYFTTPTMQCIVELETFGISFFGVNSPAARLNFTNPSINLVLGQTVTLNASVADYFGNPSNVYVDVLLLPATDQLVQDVPYTLQGFRGFTIQNGSTATTVYITGENQNETSKNYNLHFESSTASIGTGTNLSLNILPCPFGFSYSPFSAQCVCDSSNLYCNLDSAYACVLRGSWHGMVDGTYVTSPCYSGYCDNIVNCNGCANNQEFIDEYCQLPAQDANEQCEAYRQGILCTECQDNYAFTFGAINCVSIDTCQGANAFIPFIVMVAFQVIFVIALVIVLKLGYGTKSAYVYAFVYYYSIVRTLIPANKVSPSLLLVISIFESMTQLNPQFLGYVDICFPTEITILEQKVLQYINPILITLMVLGLVFLSRYCSKYVNFKDNTPVRAICLLILLSFTALSITSYKILTPITFEGLNQTYVSIQPSVAYFSEEHIYFFIIASLVTGVFVVPFTLFLLLAPSLMRVCNLVRVKPLLDEFQGCYKDRYRWMAEFYFLCRLVYLILGHSFNASFDYSEYLFQLLSFGFANFHLFLQPYKDNKLNIADVILLSDITLVTLLYSGTADVLFAGSHTLRSVLTYFLILLPVFVLVCLLISTFNPKSYLKNKLMAILCKRLSRSKQDSQNAFPSAIALLHPLVNDDGGKVESQKEEPKRQFRESVLEIPDSSHP